MNTYRFLAFVPCFMIIRIICEGAKQETAARTFDEKAIPSMSCIMACGLSFGESWVKVLNTEEASKNRVGELPAPHKDRKFFHQLLEQTGSLSVEEQQVVFEKICMSTMEQVSLAIARPPQTADTVRVLVNAEFVCSVFDEYQSCVGECPNEFPKSVLESPLITIKTLCGDKKTEYLKALPCLAEQNGMIQTQCKRQKDRVGVSSMLLHSNFVHTSTAKLKSALADFCNAYLNHTRCLARAVSSVCGEETRDLMKKIWLEWIQMFLPRNTRFSLPEECQKILTFQVSLTGAPYSTAAPFPAEPQAQIPRPPMLRDLETRKFFSTRSSGGLGFASHHWNHILHIFSCTIVICTSVIFV